MDNIMCVKNCYGCKMCMYKCHLRAIEGSYDTEGFFYPRVNSEKCTSCGQCMGVCPDINLTKEFNDKNIIYGVKNLNMQERYNATSGGFFEVIATYFINMGGVIYAPAFGEGYKVEYKRIQNKNEIRECRGSKYVQSDLGYDIFKLLKSDLENKRVLFVGTPCQCQGIKNVFSNKGGLTLLDFYCHGVPGQGVWLQYINHLMKTGGSIQEYKFRDKKTGWHQSSISYIQRNEERQKKIGEDKFSRWYFTKEMFRDSCFKCAFRTADRVGDITMGDFWGIERIDPDFDDEAGISLITINSERGKEVWKAMESLVECREYTDKAIPMVNFTKRKASFKTKLFRRLYFCFPCYATFSFISGVSKKSILEHVIGRKRNRHETD